MRRRRRSGFTLIEMMVALAVFSLAALALLRMTTENTRTAGELETRTLAGIVADNLAVETLVAVDPPAPGETAGETDLGGRRWMWRRIVSGTGDPALLRIEVRVSDDGVWTSAEAVLFRSVS
ncbi:type II secretion system minor pseudopilin GspI [Brevundimonas halotolerans]|uniref:Type II secretion system protein I n=1 Tax=Brevundimonas halotolerans TaxID=69670 RepID=A0A7W9A3U0_9CAUL|nr:type II secretion system minor pseudopilin GspI [Brevundimonas halotolerans]MBB5660675.1 general secretion pathway protein I [Brevundimonas halotolerans]